MSPSHCPVGSPCACHASFPREPCRATLSEIPRGPNVGHGTLSQRRGALPPAPITGAMRPLLAARSSNGSPHKVVFRFRPKGHSVASGLRVASTRASPPTQPVNEANNTRHRRHQRPPPTQPDNHQRTSASPRPQPAHKRVAAATWGIVSLALKTSTVRILLLQIMRGCSGGEM